MTTINNTELALLHRARDLADRAVIADIESEGHAHTDAQGQRWYDTRPLLDPREQPDDCIDMFRQALAYAHERGLVSAHPQHAHLVRISKAGA